jgi:hypothetical protein
MYPVLQRLLVLKQCVVARSPVIAELHRTQTAELALPAPDLRPENPHRTSRGGAQRREGDRRGAVRHPRLNPFNKHPSPLLSASVVAARFRFVTRKNLERGADVQWLSMFPGESETLFTHHTSHVTPHTSHLTPQSSLLRWFTPHSDTLYTLFLTSHISQITYCLFQYIISYYSLDTVQYILFCHKHKTRKVFRRRHPSPPLRNLLPPPNAALPRCDPSSASSRKRRQKVNRREIQFWMISLGRWQIYGPLMSVTRLCNNERLHSAPSIGLLR